jgi:hypothetical protein
MATEVTIKGGEIATVKCIRCSATIDRPILSVRRFRAAGQRILAVTPRANASEPLIIVQNWPARG